MFEDDLIGLLIEVISVVQIVCLDCISRETSMYHGSVTLSHSSLLHKGFTVLTLNL